ncbi:hypothetical protein LTR86_009649 [Recurvomyces mirabilis]|nr:hypothetical protein LTR86_009649 [Recurvomyces mirabilis]
MTTLAKRHYQDASTSTASPDLLDSFALDVLSLEDLEAVSKQQHIEGWVEEQEELAEQRDYWPPLLYSALIPGRHLSIDGYGSPTYTVAASGVGYIQAVRTNPLLEVRPHVGESAEVNTSSTPVLEASHHRRALPTRYKRRNQAQNNRSWFLVLLALMMVMVAAILVLSTPSADLESRERHLELIRRQ